MYRLHKPEPRPEPIKEILSRLFTARGWGRRQARLHLERAWTAAIGPEHAANTRVLGFRRGIRNEHDAKLRAHRIGFRKNPHDLVWGGVSGNVVVGRFAAEEQVAHASANEIGLIAALAQCRDNRDCKSF